jgi:hypothetical protein
MAIQSPCLKGAKNGSALLPRVANDALASVAARYIGEFALKGGGRRPAVEPFLFQRP